MYPDQETRLENIDLSHIVPSSVHTPVHTRRSDSSQLMPMVGMDTSLGNNEGAPPEKAGCGTELQWLIETGWPNKLLGLLRNLEPQKSLNQP